MNILENIEPVRVFYYFEQISRIPHGSGNIRAISNYLVDFALSHKLDHVQDESGNVIIRKSATEGYQDHPPVILQGHMDMVCEKDPDVEFDFEKDPLKLGVDDGFLHANGTTLGGDDGIAIAMSLAILESDDIPHPPLEVLITVDEETGLLGADALDGRLIHGSRMINLDSEDEKSMITGCAGGGTGVSAIPVKRVSSSGLRLDIRIHGLKGGHSGEEINKGRANSNILLGRFLYEFDRITDFEIISMEGGSKDNVITSETLCSIIIPSDFLADAIGFADRFQQEIRREYAITDDRITISLKESGQSEADVLNPLSQEKVIFFLRQMPFGVQKMSGAIPSLVETSLNTGILKLYDDALEVSTSVRSSLNSAKMALLDQLQYMTEFLGGDFSLQGLYPAWEYKEDSSLRNIMVPIYKEHFGRDAVVCTIHAGLECGILSNKIKDLDCVSIGPDISDIHSAKERMDIASCKRVYEYLLAVLKAL